MPRPQYARHRVDLSQAEMMSLLMPWPPTGNHAYTVARGRKILGDKGRTYRDEAIIEVKRQAKGQSVAGRISVAITAFAPDNRRRDLDNLLKLPLDCLKKAGVIEDDSHIDRLTITRGPVSGAPFLEVFIGEIREST
jgi:crossover junction endodeoxyribonuclease RusA